MIIITDKLIPKGFGAITIGPFIFIQRKHRHNDGLIAHERYHQKRQWYGLNLLWFARYYLDRKFKYQEELEAFRIELTYRKILPEKAAQWLSTKYNLDISYSKALRDLTR